MTHFRESALWGAAGERASNIEGESLVINHAGSCLDMMLPEISGTC